MEYKVIIGIGTGDLEKQVNSLIKEGWLPQGGMSADGQYVFQAMVKQK